MAFFLCALFHHLGLRSVHFHSICPPVTVSCGAQRECNIYPIWTYLAVGQQHGSVQAARSRHVLHLPGVVKRVCAVLQTGSRVQRGSGLQQVQAPGCQSGCGFEEGGAHVRAAYVYTANASQSHTVPYHLGSWLWSGSSVAADGSYQSSYMQAGLHA